MRKSKRHLKRTSERLTVLLQFSSDICIVSEHRAIKEKYVIMTKIRMSKYRNLIALLYNKFIDIISKIFEYRKFIKCN